MKRLKNSTLFLLMLLFVQSSFAQKIEDVDIPYKKFVLKNGLTLIVHEDHKAPIVAVNVWYHVGSKNEKPGKTGFAHLFEHLMFNGSENFDDDYFQALERVGATDLNGTTNQDRTNYFQNVPTSAFDLALWMESDRMGHLLGAITQEKLDEQRGVVQNEKRQGENQPYAIAYELLTKNSYPAGHPYSWTVIGSMEDLDAASLEDVHEWFKKYYGAANATLVIAGDVNADEVKEKVEEYFGDIPPGPPVARPQINIAKMTGTKRIVAEDRVPQARIYKVWNIPEWKSKDVVLLDLASDILSSGKTSRLYKRLVYDDQIATDVYAYVHSKEIGSQFAIVATAKPGVDLATVEKAIDEEMAKFLNEGPTEKEMKRVKTQYFASFVRGIERIGGFGGKSDILAQSQVFGGTPDFYKTKLKRVKAATAEDIKNATVNWLSDGVLILEIHPYPKYETVQSNVDRSKLPETGTPPDAKFPQIEQATLSNGMKILLANRKTVPVVSLTLMFDAGYSADQFALPGTASLVSTMLDEGTKTRNSLEINEELSMLGARLSSYSDLDMSYVSLNSLKSNLDKSLDIFADVVLNPQFPQNELERLKQQRLAQIKREKATPIQMGLRVFPKFLFGEGHAYAYPFTGTGYESTVEKITREDLIKFHRTWYKPNNAYLVVVGDITIEELKDKMENLFGDWKKGEVPKKNIAFVENKTKPVIYLLDKPAAQQSIIFAGEIFPPKADKENIAIETMNDILGGTFTSRINMNLREDKHWSYGSRSLILGAKAQRPFIVFALVQTDKTKESMQEVYKEVSQYVTTKPATEDELQKIKLNRVLSLPGKWETIRSVSASLSDLVRFNFPMDFYEKYPSLIKNLTVDQIRSAAKRVLKPESLVWVVVGDKEKIGKGFSELGYEIKLIDVDGNIIEK